MLRSRRLRATGRSATSSERAIRYQRFGSPTSSRSSGVRGAATKGCVLLGCMFISRPAAICASHLSTKTLCAEACHLGCEQLGGPFLALRAVNIRLVEAGGETFRRVDAVAQQ